MTPFTPRIGHVAVAHENRIIVWGGSLYAACGHLRPETPYRVLVHQDLQWTSKKTYGDVPPSTMEATAQVFEGKMFLIGGRTKNGFSNDIHSLDLSTWKWRKLDPTGSKPCKFDMGNSWLHRDRIYVFGGSCREWQAGEMPKQVDFTRNPNENVNFGWNNQLVAFHIEENRWIWPNCSGDKPSPRTHHASFIIGSKAFVFGGFGFVSNSSVNEMFCLDMETFHWEMVKPASSANQPCVRGAHTLIAIDDNRVVLYGGYTRSLYNTFQMLGDCWMLDVKTKLWTRMPHLEQGKRCNAQAVKEGQSGQIWLLGTYALTNDFGLCKCHSRAILKLTVEPLSLLMLALNAAAGERKRLEVDQLPVTLKKMFESVVGGQCLRGNIK